VILINKVSSLEDPCRSKHLLLSLLSHLENDT